MTRDQWRPLEGLRATLCLGDEDADPAVEMGGAPLAAIQGLVEIVRDHQQVIDDLTTRVEVVGGINPREGR